MKKYKTKNKTSITGARIRNRAIYTEKITHVLHKTRTFRVNDTFCLK